MTSPNLNVDHEELVQLADGHVVLIDELGGGRPPQIKGEWPSAAAAQAALGAAGTGQATMASRLGANADNLRASAGAFHGQEGQNKEQLEDLGKVGQFVQAILGPAAQMEGSFTGLAGQSLQAAAGGLTAAAYPFSSVAGQLLGPLVTSSQHHDLPAHDLPATNVPTDAPFPNEHEATTGTFGHPRPEPARHPGR